MNFKSPELKDFKPEEYFYYGLWKQDLFSASFWADSFSTDTLNRIGITALEPACLDLAGGHFFIKHAAIQNVQGQIKAKILAKDAAFFSNMMKVADDLYVQSLKEADEIKNAEVTVENIEKFYTAAKRINFIWALAAEHFVVAGEEMLQEQVVHDQYPAESVSARIPKLITPLYYQHKEQLELKREIGNKTLDQLKNDATLWKKLEDHTIKYAWIEIANFIGESLSVERLYDQIIHAKDEEATEIIVPKASTDLTFYAECMHDLGYVKQASAEHYAIMSEKVFPFLKRVAEKLGITYREFVALNTMEIISALKGELSTIDLKEKTARRSDMKWAVFRDDQQQLVFIDDKEDIDALVNLMVPKAEKDSKQIKGQIGNKGKVTGKVRIVMNTDDFAKMQTGEILVTTMTTPDFVILMQKASGIVTDIGGLLCHAAIVSREINKPCIIGTKFATQILKDGDMVEVDAEKGIVTIL